MARFVLRLLEPDLCLSCRFAKTAIAVVNGTAQRMVHCTRLDCDNWEIQTAVKPDSVDFGEQP